MRAARAEKKVAPYENIDLSPFYARLPFALTGAQKRAVEEILGDFQKGAPMNRLVQGDVGSGKTMVAAAAAYCTHLNGFQTALMAPTEILAEQHYESLGKLFAPLGVHTVLLTGSQSQKEKRVAREALASGEAHIAVGTHALISESTVFANLGLVITDEQHRFGVDQRSRLSAKGRDPHILVMSATPIPRTLALLMYGDLDVSVLDELPPGRQKVDTFLVGESYRARINAFIRRQVTEGGLTQLYGLKYGTLPLVRRTGGLADTVSDSSLENLADGIASGFVFEDSNAWSLLRAIRRAFVLWSRPSLWRYVQRQAMSMDFSWHVAAQSYRDLYQRLM